MINGVCPGCYLCAPISLFLVDAKHKEALGVAAKLPTEIGEPLLPYLSLFRPATGRVVSAGKALRLVSLLSQMVTAGHVQVQGKPARPCPPQVWAAAMVQMHDRQDKINRPLPNHNYLREVAWTLADQADAGAERDRNQQERSGNLRSYTETSTRPKGWSALDNLMKQGLSDE